MRRNVGLNYNGSNVGGKKGPGSRDVSKAELTGLADGVEIECERRAGVQGESKVLT